MVVNAGATAPSWANQSTIAAGSATNATYATSAGSATNADAATNATYATSAGSATNATNATYAAFFNGPVYCTQLQTGTVSAAITMTAPAFADPTPGELWYRLFVEQN